MQFLLTRLSLAALALSLMILPVTAGVGAAPDSQQTPAVGAAPDSPPIPDRYIVVLKDDVVDPRRVANEQARQRGLTVHHVYQHTLKGFAARIPPGQPLAAVRADPQVLFVSEDLPVQAFGQQAQAGDQQVPTGVRRIGGSSNGGSATNKGAGVGVAVIDTGIDLTHLDLVGVVSGTNCVNGSAPANDDNGHGSHVAGTIAARDNGIGVVGVAPAATLYAVKVLDARGGGSWSSVICGIDWVTANVATISVANMSLGGRTLRPPSSTSNEADCTNRDNDALHYAICKSVKAGVTHAVAAGNSRQDASRFVPAAYEEVITVSALADYNGTPGGNTGTTCANYGADDTFASFSNYGAPVDIAAPGVCIHSTWMGGGYNTISGTSMAAPHVAGAAALYRATHPLASPLDVKRGLVTAREPGPIPGDPDRSKEGIIKISGL